MGRTEPSYGRPPAGFRRDVRAKRAKATANKVIPALLSAHPRARRGVESAELIVDPPPLLRGGRRDSGAPVGSSDGESERKTKKKKNKKASPPPPPPPPPTRSGEDGGAGGGRPRISMRVAETLAVARSLLTMTTAKGKAEDLGNRDARVGILNMASPLAPGGGFLNGSAAQQEEGSLCMRTTLLPSLRDGFYRLPELGAVYTPDVLVFRDSAADEDGGGGDGDSPLLGKADRWFVDCVSAAMLRMPETEEVDMEVAAEPEPEPEAGDGDGDGDDADVDAGAGMGGGRRRVYADTADRELVRRKMRVVMRVFQAKGVKRVVLGAWGCGAYGNPVEEIAEAWKKVLLGSGREGNGNGKGRKNAKKEETWEGIEEVVFAIRSAGLAERFARAFGDGLVQEEQETHEEATEESQDGDDLEEAISRELRDKIQQMELQIQQARNPHMRSGLSAVIASLRSQLSEGAKSSHQHGSSSHTHEDEEDGEDEGTDDAPSEDDTGQQDNL
ncbi:hypothetical protein DL764_007160 [Monosporascus ibericus]|uniref:Microbial-type PARG catalytic domain-containing protein n=1 Tax=Monosporascus ibericus TaxID=155417 RepID=A0A4Q4T4U3_9PEZI|nr:hypothetical protein DL764_007160 [Monosporascus ibericus]